MNLGIKSGKYVVAVSGGVDSIVLLNVLSKMNELDLVVGHFDHGIRINSKDDRLFVEVLAEDYGLPFFSQPGNLGKNTSEAEAREARYKFLRKIKNQTGSKMIITAHHQDDIIETAIINLLRGTKARGLSSLKSTAEIARPLLGFSKQEIISYAKRHDLAWREDETNQQQKYLRNYIRYNIVPKMSSRQRKDLLKIIDSSAGITNEIADIINDLWPKNDQINRYDFINLPHSVACELLASWLQKRDFKVDKKTVQRLVVGLKSTRNGLKLDINQNYQFLIENGIIKFLKKEKL